MNSKIKSRKKLSSLLKRLRKLKKKIVFTNGCFDILHYGHVDYLRKAKKYGDFLMVGLNTDRSVRALKGKGRPIHPERDRAEILSELCCVDGVTFFGELTPLHLIHLIRPDVLVKGADWELKDIVGRDFIESYGGKVRRVPLVPGRSTTHVLKKMEGG